MRHPIQNMPTWNFHPRVERHKEASHVQTFKYATPDIYIQLTNQGKPELRKARRGTSGLH